MTGFPPPRTHPLVWEYGPQPGYSYLTDELPLGSEHWRWRASWTEHLTNALHDAGFYVSQRRRLKR